MLNDKAVLGLSGKVKLEMYNDEGVFNTIEKKNMIVTGSNEIIANMMTDPSKRTRYSQTDKGDSLVSRNKDSYFAFELEVSPQAIKTVTKEFSEVNSETEFTLDNSRDIQEIISVKVNNVDKVVNKDVFIKNGELGVIEFAEAPTSSFTIEILVLKDKHLEIVRGSESVTVGGTPYTKADIPSDASKNYTVNYTTGEVYFETAKTNVEVKYDILSKYSLGFMGMADRPTDHPQGVPVSFSQGDKTKTRMDNEYLDARMPIIYPATLETAKAEVEVFPTKAIETTKQYKVVAIDQNLEDEINKIYQIEDSGKKVMKLVSVNKVGEEDTPLKIGEDVLIEDQRTGKIKFVAEVVLGDE